MDFYPVITPIRNSLPRKKPISILRRIGIWLGLIKTARGGIINFEINGAGISDRGDWFRKMLADLAPAPAIPDREISRAIARHEAAGLKLEIAARQFAEVVIEALQNG